MKYITERTEIAQALNFGKYPVIKINVEECHEDYNDYYVGDDVKVDTGRGYYTKGQIYKSEGKYEISNEATCLHSSFGYSDVMEDYRWAKAALIKEGQTVVVIEDYPKTRGCSVRMMKV